MTGSAPSFDAFQRIAQAAANLPSGFTMAKTEIAPPVVSPYLWSATRDANGITLQGNVPSEEIASPQSRPHAPRPGPETSPIACS